MHAFSREQLHVIHAGELYAGRDPRPYIEAIGMLQVGGWRIQTCFLGGIASRSRAGFDVEEEIRRSGVSDSFELRGQAPYGEALKLMQQADLLY